MTLLRFTGDESREDSAKLSSVFQQPDYADSGPSAEIFALLLVSTHLTFVITSDCGRCYEVESRFCLSTGT